MYRSVNETGLSPILNCIENLKNLKSTSKLEERLS